MWRTYSLQKAGDKGAGRRRPRRVVEWRTESGPPYNLKGGGEMVDVKSEDRCHVYRVRVLEGYNRCIARDISENQAHRRRDCITTCAGAGAAVGPTQGAEVKRACGLQRVNEDETTSIFCGKSRDGAST